MNHHVLIILLISLFGFSSAHTSSISTSLPYSSGELTLLSEKDTVSFSNGIGIFTMKFMTGNYLEGVAYDGAVAFQWSAGKAFYRYNSTLKVNKLPIESNNSATYVTYAQGNFDTIWTAAKNTPLATFSSDSTIKREPDSSLKGYNCKILFAQENSTDGFYPEIKSRPFSEYNSIVYFLPAALGIPSMKIQATSFKFDTTHKQTPSGYCDQIVVSQIKIRWAIDSLGNGIFKSAIDVSGSGRTGNIPTTQAKGKAIIFNNGIVSHSPQGRYSGYFLNGSLINRNNIPTGIIVMKKPLLQ